MIKKGKRQTAYICDRCREPFAIEKLGEKPDLNDFGVDRGTYFQVPVIEKGKVRFEPRHFCGGCTLSLGDWMKNKKT